MTTPFGAHFFRHEYGRLVAMLVRRVGSRHLEAIEDAVQSSLLAAVESWPRSVVPDNPSAWLYRVAHNQLAGELRRGARQGELAVEHARAAFESTIEAPFVPLSGDVRDDLLRMLFVCCDDAIPTESQLVLALKTLCGPASTSRVRGQSSTLAPGHFRATPEPGTSPTTWRSSSPTATGSPLRIPTRAGRAS
jgi:RNA polymerase sigma-70 factor (ECF subfamily)